MLRNFILYVVGHNLASKMEADSRRWVFDCAQCGATTSVWDIGGIRYKAKGNQISRVKCPHCGHVGFCTLYYV